MSCLDLWVAAFDRLSEAIEGWDPCCDGVGAPPAGTEDVVTYDDTDIIADNTDVEGETYPSGFPTLNDFREHQCGLAHQFAGSTDELIDRIEGLATTAQNVIVFATLIVLAYANVIGMAVAAILAGGYAMVTASEIFGAASAFSELRDLLHRGDPFGADEAKIALSARYDDIVDAIYCANDATEASVNLRAILDAELSGPLLVLAKLMWSAPMLRLAFEFQGTVTPRNDCDCFIDFDFLSTVTDAQISSGAHQWDIQNGDVIQSPSGTCTGQTAVIRLNASGEILQTNVANEAQHAGYTLPASYEAYLVRVEYLICQSNAGLTMRQCYAAAADETEAITATGDLGWVVWEPPSGETEPAGNCGGGAPGTRLECTIAQASLIAGMRTYWRVVAL